MRRCLLLVLLSLLMAAPAAATEFAPLEDPDRAQRIKPRLTGLSLTGGTLIGLGGVGLGTAITIQAIDGDYTWSPPAAALFFASPFTIGTGVALLIGAAIERKKARAFIDEEHLRGTKRTRRMRAATIVWTVSGSLLLAGGVGMGTAGLAQGDFAGLLAIPGITFGTVGGAFLVIGQSKAGKLLRVGRLRGMASASPAQRASLQWGMSFGAPAAAGR